MKTERDKIEFWLKRDEKRKANAKKQKFGSGCKALTINVLRLLG